MKPSNPYRVSLQISLQFWSTAWIFNVYDFIIDSWKGEEQEKWETQAEYDDIVYNLNLPDFIEILMFLFKLFQIEIIQSQLKH